MESASPTPDRIATGHRDRSGEAFDVFTGGTVTPSDTSTDGREFRRAPERRPHRARHPAAEGHGPDP